MRFFLDSNLSPRLAEGMRAFGESVEHLKESFPEDARDIDWLPYVGRKGIFLITRDERIRYRPIEQRALKDHRVGAFFLGGKRRSHCQLVQQLVRCWPRIKEHARKTRRPFALRIASSGQKFTHIPLQ